MKVKTQQTLNHFILHLEKRIAVKRRDLTSLLTLAEKFNLIKFNCPVITVTGTNGKGSVLAILEAIMTAANFKVLSLSSPHLFVTNERIRINQSNISDSEFLQYLQYIDEITHSSLNYFDHLTLTFLAFAKKQQPDFILLEVGIGGKLDAVNIVDSDIAVITQIALDHTEKLGKARSDIAREKAGILRSNKILILGEPDPPENLWQIIKEKAVICDAINRDFLPSTLDHPYLHPNNLATALQVIQRLKVNYSKLNEFIEIGLKQVKLKCRFERVFKNINLIFDVAHNPAACQYLANRLKNLPIIGKTFAVCGFNANKDLRNSLLPMLSVVDVWHLCPNPSANPASLKDLTQVLHDQSVNQWYTHHSVALALQAVKSTCTVSDRILIFGSFYIVAAAYHYLV